MGTSTPSPVAGIGWLSIVTAGARSQAGDVPAADGNPASPSRGDGGVGRLDGRVLTPTPSRPYRGWAAPAARASEIAADQLHASATACVPREDGASRRVDGDVPDGGSAGALGRKSAAERWARPGLGRPRGDRAPRAAGRNGRRRGLSGDADDQDAHAHMSRPQRPFESRAVFSCAGRCARPQPRSAIAAGTGWTAWGGAGAHIHLARGRPSDGRAGGWPRIRLPPV